MKNTRHFLLSVLLLAVGLGAMIAADSAHSTTPPVPTVAEVTKERDEAKAQVAQLQQQNQQQQIVAEYYKAVAEKNDAVLRVVALQQELTATKAQLATVQAELDAAKKTPEIKK